MKINKKLIEAALPLDAINVASAREKSIRHGHPSTLHLWWARRPLAAARAVIFSQMVDDPSAYVDVLLADSKTRRRAETILKARLKVWEEARAISERAAKGGIESQVPAPGLRPDLRGVIAEIERERLFVIIRKLVLWENTTNEDVLQEAREEIWQSWRRTCAENADHPRSKELFDRHKLPAFHDPFAGGGALPLEAQRLGLQAYASDLNPVAVLINKAMIEIPPKFAGKPPVNPDSRKKLDHSQTWHGARGLAEDVRYYGQWVRDEAEKRIGHLYPKIAVTVEMATGRHDLKPYVGKELTVIAWLWARTVKSPNPAFRNVDVPLASTFMLSTKEGQEAYVQPVIEDGGYRFTVKTGKPRDESAQNGTKLSRGANFRCLMSSAPISSSYIQDEIRAGRHGSRLMAIVAETESGRRYLPPTEEAQTVALGASPDWKPDVEFLRHALGFRIGNYGMAKWSDLFTNRQLVTLATFSELVQEVAARVHEDAIKASESAEQQGTFAKAYSDAIATYLALAVDKGANLWSSLCFWMNDRGAMRETFAMQILSMVWDYAEANPFSSSGGNVSHFIDKVAMATSFTPAKVGGSAQAADAATQAISSCKLIATDPPYYDNIGYADLSDFFYVWLRRTLRSVYPDLFELVAVPKAEELVATPARHGGKANANAFFLEGMTRAMRRLAEQSHPAFPVALYYAFKQSESNESEGTASTGWDTFLESVIRAGLAISGTWPMRTEQTAALKSTRNALASSIVLVCRPRPLEAPSATRREFVNTLKVELPNALADLQRGNVAPVDLAQAAIGPGMAVYTRYESVFDAQGNTLTVRQALALINEVLDETLAQQEGDFDPDTRWAVTWFEENGFAEGEYGRAEQLSVSRNTSVAGLQQAGIVRSGKGKVQLLKPTELADGWNPVTDPRLTAWEIIHQLIRTLERGGESQAAELVAKLGAKAETARELAYRLYTISERKKRSAEALSYNGLVQSWPEIMRLARTESPQLAQEFLFRQ